MIVWVLTYYWYDQSEGTDQSSFCGIVSTEKAADRWTALNEGKNWQEEEYIAEPYTIDDIAWAMWENKDE